MDEDAPLQLERFLSKYTPQMQVLARDLLARMRLRIPGAVMLVYDNYNGLVIGFGSTERPSRAVLSLAVMPRWVTLCFLHGAALADPHGLLKGGGNQVRSIRLGDASMLQDPRLEELVAQAIHASDPPFDAAAEQRMVIRSVSAKQRPRRP